MYFSSKYIAFIHFDDKYFQTEGVISKYGTFVVKGYESGGLIRLQCIYNF